MQTTDNYNLNLYEGDDYFNPLTVENVNSRAIDEALKENADNSVTTANHLKSNTVHALTRTDGDARMFTFRATSRYEIGDSFTVDGVAVTTLTVGGASIPGGAFVIGSIVLCSLVGQLLTIYGVGSAEAENAQKLGGNLPSFYAKQSELNTTTALAENASTVANQNSTKLNNLQNDYNSRKYTKYGTAVPLLNYTSASNRYVFPTDGMVITSASGANTYRISYIYNPDGSYILGAISASTSAYTITNTICTPVFKGMSAYTGGTSGATTFVPFVV